MQNQESDISTTDLDLIMMVDDEIAITDSLGYSLRNAGFKSIAAGTLTEANHLLHEYRAQIKLVILDLSLPDGHGFDWLKKLRNTSPLPVIILSSHDDEIEHIVGLEIGADDFIDKPFSPREVVARVRAVLRRTQHAWSASIHPTDQSQVTRSEIHALAPPQENSTSDLYHSSLESELQSNEQVSVSQSTELGVWIDYDQYRVVYDDVSLGLSQQEFSLFDAICSGQGKVFTRATLLRVAWGGGVSVSERTVDVHITSLRKKWTEHHEGELIETVRGVGYRLADGAPMIQTRGVKPL